MNCLSNIKEIKQQNKPIITCCRLGARLNTTGIEVYHGGSWIQVQSALKDLETVSNNR